MQTLRIVSLLPALTELVCALGHETDLVGVSHECDEPPAVARLPRLTKSRIAIDASSAAIDIQVCEHAGSLYELSEELLIDLRPDLILTQAQCDVCAVDERAVRAVAARLPGAPLVLSVNPTTLDEVFAMFTQVAEALSPSAVERASDIIERIVSRSNGPDRTSETTPRVLLLEWIDPPYCSGHWNPEIIALAGGIEVLGRSGARSRRCGWDEIARAAPDLVIVAPCGFPIERAEREMAVLNERSEWRALPAVRNERVMLVDGNAYFSRPGPRLEDSVRIARAAIHREACSESAVVDRLPGWRWHQV